MDMIKPRINSWKKKLNEFREDGRSVNLGGRGATVEGPETTYNVRTYNVQSWIVETTPLKSM